MNSQISLKPTTAVVLMIILIAGTALAAGQERPRQPQGVPIKTGFVTGQVFLFEWSPQERKAFAMGVVDGMLLAPMFGAPTARLQWFESCVVGMTDQQVAAIIEKHLRDRPGKWHQSLNLASYGALLVACGGKEGD